MEAHRGDSSTLEAVSWRRAIQEAGVATSILLCLFQNVSNEYKLREMAVLLVVHITCVEVRVHTQIHNVC